MGEREEIEKRQRHHHGRIQEIEFLKVALNRWPCVCLGRKGANYVDNRLHADPRPKLRGECVLGNAR